MTELDSSALSHCTPSFTVYDVISQRFLTYMPTGHRGHEIGGTTQEQHKKEAVEMEVNRAHVPHVKGTAASTLANDSHAAMRTPCWLELTVFQKKSEIHSFMSRSPNF